MRSVSFDDITAMTGNGSSMRHVLKYFIDKGATVSITHEDITGVIERFFLVEYEGLKIPLRAYDLKFYSVLNSGFSRYVTNDKYKTGVVLSDWQIPTPPTALYQGESAAMAFIERYGSCVVKPRDGAHGDGITVGVTGQEALRSAIAQAQAVDPDVLLQAVIPGTDHRLLFIDYKFVAAVQRTPASAVGDGVHSVRELVETSNDHITTLIHNIRAGAAGADEATGSISRTPLAEVIAARGDSFLETVPAAGETVQLLDKANVSLGGQTTDVTDRIPAELTDKLTALLTALDLPLCGVDVLSTDISHPLSDNNSFVIELNDAPGLRLHELPAHGQPRPVCAQVAESVINYYRGHNNP